MNISIAFGAYIENAKGSSAGDLIVGNILANRLEGNGGADVIYAEGIDSIHEAGNGTYDRVTSVGASKTEAPSTPAQAFIDDPASQQDHLLGGAGDDHLRGGRGSDLIEGGADNDYIIGGGGADEIWGGDKDNDQGSADGTDTVTYAASTAGITINFNGDGVNTSLTVSDGAGGTDTLHSIEKIVATSRTDYLYYNGEIPDGYALEIDLGSDQGDVIANAAGASTSIQLQIGTGGTGTLKGAGPGTINLLNAGTQIIGSYYDDEISDLAVHEGIKRIDGGDGDDVITVDGSDAMIRGGWGDDEIEGGAGSDVLYGGVGGDILRGGAGSDWLQNDEIDDYFFSDDEEMFGGDGHDYLKAVQDFGNLSLTGGGGNDVIDALEADSVRVIFGADDGHDTLLAGSEVATVFMAGLSSEDVTFIWDIDPEESGFLHSGDLVVRVNGSGATLFLAEVEGALLDGTEDDPWVYQTYALFGDFDLEFELPHSDPPWPMAVVGENLQFGSVAQYDVALADYLAATAADPADTQGTSGDDELAGGIGDDALSGDDGDDAFQSSGGEDAIDGGAGDDSLFLFGAFGDFAYTRDTATGEIAIEDLSGLEGTITIKSVEKIYFAADNETYEPGDLVGFWGTPNDDALIEGNWRGNLVFGLAGADLLRGLDGADSLDGGDGADRMEGGGDGDLLNGGAGDDLALGGSGDDSYIVEQSGDIVVEAAGGGYDTVYTLTSFELGFGEEIETLTVYDRDTANAIDLTGNDLANTIYGNRGANLLNGGAGDDLLFGLDGSDAYIVEDAGDVAIEAVGGGFDTVYILVSHRLAAGQEIETLTVYDRSTTNAVDLAGNDLANTVYGNAGSNTIDGKGGLDTLYGMGGADTFAFSTAPVAGNADNLADFSAADDMIALDDVAFLGIGGPGALAANAFTTGTAATTAEHRIIHDQATGRLFFDADGNGAGAAILFATLQNPQPLGASDFIVI